LWRAHEQPPSGPAAQEIADATSKPPFLYEIGVDAARLAVAGDSVGGNVIAALTLLARQCGDVTFVHQSMCYPAPRVHATTARCTTS
jgi:alpha/beta hydrolase family protein